MLTVEDPERRKAIGTFKLLQQIMTDEGFESLYTGMIPVLQSLCISNFLYFYTFHGLKTVFGTATHSPLRDLCIGMVAGVVNVMATTPIWVVNTRLKSKEHSVARTPGQKRPAYNNLIEGLWYIFKTEGVYGLWAGAIPSLLLVSNPALQFMMYEALKRRFSKIPQQTSAIKYFILGAMAKAFSTLLTYPLQLVQTKLRQGQKDKSTKINKSPIDSDMAKMFISIVNKYGALGLFRGLEAKLLQTVLTAALMFMAYEKIAKTVTSFLIRKPK